MNDTVIYLIRHAETVEENGIRNTSENFQMINEKEILSIKGEEQSKKLSENTELQNLDVIWTSNYTRAKATAKYIAYKNNLQYNIDKRLSERKLGNMDDKSVCLSEHGDGGPYFINEIDLPKDAKTGEVYEKIDGKFIYNATITEELNKIEKE